MDGENREQVLKSITSRVIDFTQKIKMRGAHQYNDEHYHERDDRSKAHGVLVGYYRGVLLARACPPDM